MGTENFATLADLALTVKDSRPELTKAIQLQAQTNDIWNILPLFPCNDGTKEQVLLNKELPEVAWRIINRGVKPTKAGASMVTYSTGGKEAICNIDERLMKLNNNSNEWRMFQGQVHQTSLSNEMSTTIFYGDEKINPAGFTGLSAFYYSKADQDKYYADQIIDAGGTGDNLTSIWMVVFSQQSVYGIYPAGTTAGYDYKDNGRVQAMDEEGRTFWCYQSQFNWDLGLALKDPRQVVRIANVDLANLTGSDLINFLIEGYFKLYDPRLGRPALLCNRSVETALAKAAANKNNVQLNIGEFAGRKISEFWTLPVLRNEAILNTESQLV